MKKINIFLTAALALCLASCDDKSDLGIAQVNEPETPFSVDGLTVTGTPSSVNLDATVNQMIPVISVSEMQNLPENATVGFEMQLATDEFFTNPETLNVLDGAVSSDKWEEFVLNHYGKSPAVVENYIRFAAYVLNGGQLSRLGGETKWFATTQVSVTPVDLKLDVESAYYLVAGDSKTEFSHSDAHPYDDPNFSLMFEVADDALPFEWMIAPESASAASGFYGVSQTGSVTDFSGNLVLGGAKGVISEAGKYSMKLNMLDKTYEISKIAGPDVEYLYTPGGANGWGFGDDNMKVKNNGDQTFSGYVYVDGEFKFATDSSWAQNWGLNGGVLTAGGDNIKVDPSGLYYLNANFNNMTLGATLITRIGVIGDFNGWGSDVALTPNANYTIWSGDIDFSAAGGWKFRMNDGWDLNLGGVESNLVQNGDNLPMAETGTYTVTLDLSKFPYSCTVVKK